MKHICVSLAPEIGGSWIVKTLSSCAPSPQSRVSSVSYAAFFVPPRLLLISTTHPHTHTQHECAGMAPSPEKQAGKLLGLLAQGK